MLESIKILGLTFLVLVGISILVYGIKKYELTPLSKIKLSCIVAFLISAYTYVGYLQKMIDNRISDRNFRDSLALKISANENNSEGTKGENLTISEYEKVRKYYGFPQVRKQSNSISYKYEYEDFFNDYYFHLTYDLPAAIKVDSINIDSSNFSKFQTSKLFGKLQTVTYEEIKR